MIKLIQILTFFKKRGFTLSQVIDELTEIVDNSRSEYFELTGNELTRIAEIFEDDRRFTAALTMSHYYQ